MCRSCLHGQITRRTFNQGGDPPDVLCFLLEARAHVLPGAVFPSIKTVRPRSKATDGRRQTRTDSGSPSQLLWHVGHAGMPRHSPLLRQNKRPGPTPFWSAGPKWLTETWGVTEPQTRGQESSPDLLFFSSTATFHPSSSSSSSNRRCKNPS